MAVANLKTDPATFTGEGEVAADIAEILLLSASDDAKIHDIAQALLPALPDGLSPEDEAGIAEGIARMVLEEWQAS